VVTKAVLFAQMDMNVTTVKHLHLVLFGITLIQLQKVTACPVLTVMIAQQESWLLVQQALTVRLKISHVKCVLQATRVQVILASHQFVQEELILLVE
jgi:hypothetical protein